MLAAVPVEVRPFAICVDQLELGEELRHAPNPGNARVVISLSATRELRVRAAWPDGQSIERKVPATPAECTAVRRVVLALVRAWVATPPAPKPKPVEPIKPVETPKPTSPIEVEGPRPRPPPTPPIPEPEPEPKPEPREEAVVEPPPPPPDIHWRFGAGALGGGMAGTTSAVAAVGSFFVELTHDRRLGVGLEGGLESSRASPTAYATQRWLTLYARGAVGLSDRVTMAATLGARAWFVETGAPLLPARTLIGGGAALTVGPEVALGPVQLLVRAAFAVRFPEERILIAGNTAVFLRWWQVGLVAGLAWHFP